MSCIASRAMVAALAAYLLAGLGHSPVLTWAAVAVSVVAVVAWSRRGRSAGRPVRACGPVCSIKSGSLGRERDVPGEPPPGELETTSVSEERP